MKRIPLQVPLFVVSALLSFFWFLASWGRTPNLDWAYSNSLTLFIRSAIFNYFTLPIHQPWFCGGLDLLHNPQNRLFSPMVLFDLLFAPYEANLFSLIFYALLGQWGAYLLLRHFALSRVVAILGAILFINSSWLGMHFTEGQISYGSFQLMPFVIWSTLRLSRPRQYILLCFLLAYFLIEGGIYQFIFSLYLVGGILLLDSNVRRSAAGMLWRNKEVALSGLGIFLLISAPKTVPVVMNVGDRVPILENYVMSMNTVFYAFFHPFQDVLRGMGNEGNPLRFNEFGCYIGFLSLLLVCLRIPDTAFFRHHWRWIGLGTFFFWMGSGWGTPLNPWTLHQKLPLFNNAHIQSRLLFLFFITYWILLCHALEHLKKNVSAHRAWIFWVISLGLVAEYTFVKTHPTRAVFSPAQSSARLKWNQFMTSDNLDETVRQSAFETHLLDRNKGSEICYESAQPKKGAFWKGSEKYRGEAYFHSGSGHVGIDRYTPGRLRLSTLSHEADPVIGVNTNQLKGWRVVSGPAEIIDNPDHALKLKVQGREAKIELRYFPSYLPWTVLLQLAGWVGLAVTLRRNTIRKK